MDYSTTSTASDGAAGLIICGLYVCLCLLSAIGFGFWIWMLIDVVKRQFPAGKENEKTTWIIVVAITGWIGALVYYFMIKKKYDAMPMATTTSMPEPSEKLESKEAEKAS